MDMELNPTSGWINKAKSTRFTGSEKAFSDQLKQTVEKLEQVMEKALDEDTRSEQQKTEDSNLLKACKEVYNTPSFQRAVDWCSQLGKGKLSAFILYDKTKVDWEVTLSHHGNYRMLYVLITNHDPKADVLEDCTAPDAISKMERALEKHGCWTVSPHSWYLQRYRYNTDVCDYLLPPSDLSSGYEKKDRWMSGIDGSEYVPKEHLSQTTPYLQLRHVRHQGEQEGFHQRCRRQHQ